MSIKQARTHRQVSSSVCEEERNLTLLHLQYMNRKGGFNRCVFAAAGCGARADDCAGLWTGSSEQTLRRAASLFLWESIAVLSIPRFPPQRVYTSVLVQPTPLTSVCSTTQYLSVSWMSFSTCMQKRQLPLPSAPNDERTFSLGVSLQSRSNLNRIALNPTGASRSTPRVPLPPN